MTIADFLVARWATLAMAATIVSAASAALGQIPDLSGTWVLDPRRSEIDAGTTYGGLAGNVAVPSRLYVTQARNGTVIVGSSTNTSRARTYRTGGESMAPFEGGEVMVSSRWQGGALIVEGRDEATNGSLREVLAMSTDGGTLTVTITLRHDTSRDGSGERSSTLLYARTMSEPPCREWATPCRDWSAETAQIAPP